MKKISQKQMVFYKLLTEAKKDRSRFVPAWEFGGEMYISELDTWVLMSYKCPTRLTDIYQENPGLLEREIIEGKSGASYYGYRLNSETDSFNYFEQFITDPRLSSFYQKVK